MTKGSRYKGRNVRFPTPPLGRDHSLWISGREKLLESTHVAEQLCTYMGKRIRWILLAGNPFYLYQLATHIPLHPKLFQL